MPGTFPAPGFSSSPFPARLTGCRLRNSAHQTDENYTITTYMNIRATARNLLYFVRNALIDVEDRVEWSFRGYPSLEQKLSKE